MLSEVVFEKDIKGDNPMLQEINQTTALNFHIFMDIDISYNW